jgi:hypothetical protein
MHRFWLARLAKNYKLGFPKNTKPAFSSEVGSQNGTVNGC